MADYDIAIIGGGPGGYNAAVEAAGFGLKVALVEDKKLGGTCLHLGCIPTKTLYEGLKRGLSFKEAIENAKSTVSVLYEQLNKLLTHPRIKIINGKGILKSKNEVSVIGSKEEEFTANNIIVATGSMPILPEDYKSNKSIITSDDILELKEFPKKITIIGGGYIGCEYATIFAGFGSKVKVIEAAQSILSTEDKDIIDEIEQSFKSAGIEFCYNAKFNPDKEKGLVLYAAGRMPNIDNLGTDKLGIQLGNKNSIKVNERMQTNISNIYAIGDVVDMPLRLAHVAEAEGIVAVHNIAGKQEAMNYDAIPTTIFTNPLITSVGKREHQLAGTDYVVGKSKYSVNPMSHCRGDTTGFVKIISEKSTGRILGATAIGDDVDLHEVAIAIQLKGKVEVLARTIRFHPSKSEAIKKAAENALRKV